MKRSELIAAVRQLVLAQTPYVHAGRDAVHGVDCVGVITHACDSVGYPYVDLTNYPAWPDGRLIERLEPFGDRVTPGDERPGDVPVLWINRRSKVPQHTGLLTDLPGRLGFAHALINLGRVVETGFDESWRKRLLCTIRFRGVED